MFAALMTFAQRAMSAFILASSCSGVDVSGFILLRQIVEHVGQGHDLAHFGGDLVGDGHG